jgi:hypothetical protein
MSYRFSHPVPLDTPSFGYGGMDVTNQQIGVTQRGSVWSPASGDATRFTARWAQDDWKQERLLSRNELQRYKDATVRVFPYTPQGQKDAFAFARQLLGGAALPMPGTPQSPIAAPGVYAPVPTAAPGAQPPATAGGSITDEAWFWPAAIGGSIALVALVWALTPPSAGPKVVIRKAASRFTGF